MAVCSGINRDGTRITVDYPSGGDVKGNSFDDPYTLQDIYDTDVDNGWGLISKYGNVYISNASIHIKGADTYFQDGGFILSFQGSIDDIKYIEITYEANIKITNTEGTIIDGFDQIVFDGDSQDFYNINFNNSTYYPWLYEGYYKNLKFNNLRFNPILKDNCQLENIVVANCQRGFQIAGNPTSMENIQIIDCDTGVRIDRVSVGFDINNIQLIGVDTHIYFLPRYDILINANIINSNINIDSYGINPNFGGTQVAKLKSTFTVNITNADGATATLYD